MHEIQLNTAYRRHYFKNHITTSKSQKNDRNHITTLKSHKNHKNQTIYTYLL